MSTIPSYPELAEIARTSPCSYVLIHALAVLQPRNRVLELNYAHDLLQTSGHDFTRIEIEEAFQKMAAVGLGVVKTLQTEDVIFSWSALPLVLQEGLRLGCLPAEFVSVPAPFDENKVLEIASTLESKGVPIVAVLNGGRGVKLEVPYQLSQRELDQIMNLLTSLRKSADVKDDCPFPEETDVDMSSLEDDPEDLDLDADRSYPFENEDEFDELVKLDGNGELPSVGLDKDKFPG